MALVSLPIDPLLPDAVRKLTAKRALVLEAEPGAGKTTRFPWAVMEGESSGEVVVLQPRRLAARLAARRIASERGERVGERVGYQVRFEDVSSPRTRIRLVTEGVLTRRLLSDPTLKGVSTVILDEFHERHLQGDLALALLRQLQLGARPDLRIAVMSATLDPEPVARFLGGAPCVKAPGRRFEVAIEYQPTTDARHLDQQIAGAVRRLIGEGLEGDVLVFLPGAAEIRRALQACEPVAQSAGLDLVPLHGDLSPEEQDRAVRPGSRRKVILSTNVAESSVTIEGVVAVIDSGLVRVAGHSPWSGLPTLKTGKVSKASAVQRSGRAGRTGPGRALRLYTQHDFAGRPDHETPEMNRLDLTETVLALHGLGHRDPRAFEWFEAPPAASLEAAEELLARLGALDAAGSLTDVGRALLAFPLHPRQARVVLEARARQVGEEGALVAAILGEGDIRESAGAQFGPGGPRQASVSASSDVLEAMAAFQQAEKGGLEPHRLRSWGLDPTAARSVQRVRDQVRRISGSLPAKPRTADVDQALQVSILAGYPDRVARRREAKAAAPGGGSSELLLSGGGSATLDERSVVRDAVWMVATDAEEREAPRGAPTRSGARVRQASAIEPDWLLDLPGDWVKTESVLHWNDSLERVEGTSRMVYDGLVIEESRETAFDPAAAAAVLRDAARAKGATAFGDPEELAALLGRLAFATVAVPELAIRAPSEAAVAEVMARLCEGRKSFAELREAGLLEAILESSGVARHQLDEVAPTRTTLTNGRQTPIHYEPTKPPWLESFLQDFFGLADGPRVARGRVPLVLHLLAPNRRDVQVTTDLAGFWERHYAGVKKELGRRYPRHSWPDDPRHAVPPPPRAPRRPR